MTRPDEVWERLGEVDTDVLREARLQTHHAVQLLASFGQTLLPPRKDDSHRSMGWGADPPAFVSEPSTLGLRAAVVVDPLRLELRRPSGRMAGALPLQGRSLPEARSWLAAAVAREGSADPGELAWPDFEIPEHAVGDGRPFDAPPRGLAELARWYGNVAPILREVAAGIPGTGAVRAWPHHFDVATLITVVEAEGDRRAHTVGAGLSPGEGPDGDPYLYVNLWPAPDPSRLPGVDGPGSWHSDGWTGAVLPAAELVGAGGAEAQAARARAFLALRVEVARSVQDEG